MSEKNSKFSFETICDFISHFAGSMNDYLYVLDLKTDEYFGSPRLTERFLVDSNHTLCATDMFRKLVYPDDYEMLREDLAQMASGAQTEHDIQYRWLGKEREIIWIRCKGRMIPDENGQLRYMLGCVNEIGKKPVADNLSGFLECFAIEEEIEERCQEWEKGYILRIGIDDFKDINERMGPEYGDYVLRGVAECITNSLYPGQNAYRVPTDEFIILDFTSGDERDAIGLYRRIRWAVDDLVAKNRYEAVYTISGGIATSSLVKEPDYETLMKVSQFALNEAKKNGKNQAYVFQERDYLHFLRTRDIRCALRQSVENDFDNFHLYFQPIMHADTGVLYAAESLLRFTMPDGEMVSPVEFVPILEETGLIIPVGKWILKTAVDMCKDVRQFIPDFRVSVNLSYIQILKSSVADEICSIVDDSGMAPESMIMELTESGYLEDSPAVKRVWSHLKNYGVSIALDDFGTGYSNLQSIGNLTPNVVKLDRGFTLKALKNDYENQVMRYVIEMVHSLDLKICVEGIETQEELDKIRLLSPDFIQGYFYGKPCSIVEFFRDFVHAE
jgi:diguanylate cyclase (GGDEF)-like protein